MTFMPYEDDEQGFISKSLANPWVSIPLALGTGLAAAATPGLARGVGVGNAVLQTGLAAERYNEQERRRQRINEALGKFADASTTQRKMSNVSPAVAAFSLEDDSPERIDEALSYEEKTPLFRPEQREYLKALGSAGQADRALATIGTQIFKEPTKPQIFGSAETGYHALDDGKTTPLIPGVGRREPTPPRPVSATQGGEAVDWVYNPQTKQWDKTIRPITAAPQAPKSKEDLDLIRARINAANAGAEQSRASAGQARAQTERISAIARDLKDPNMSKEKLNTYYSNLLREKQQLIDRADPDNLEDAQRIAEVNMLLDDTRSRLARITNVDKNKPGAGSMSDPLGIRSGGGVTSRGGEY